jgi:hypothetical protein
MRVILAVLMALSLIISGSALQASTASAADCSLGGCNVVHEGRWGRGLIGQTLYFDNGNAVRVLDVDYSRQTVLVAFKNGQRQWVYATALYTYSSLQQRRRNAVAGTVGAAVILCALTGCLDSKRSSPNRTQSSSQSRSQRYQSCRNQCYSNNYYDTPNREAALRHSCLQRCEDIR